MAVLWKSMCKVNFLLEVLKCYKNTQIKAYDIKDLTAELKNSDTVRYRHKIYYSVQVCWSISWAWLPETNT